MTVAKADPSALDTGALAFRLAPRINAAGRLRRADAGLELLLTDDERRAARSPAELDRVNAERRAVEQRIVWEAEAQVAELGERSAYVLAGEGWHPGVVGIVASRIVERHHRPAVVVALDGRCGLGLGPEHPRLRPAGGAAGDGRAPRALRRPPRRGRDDDPARPDRAVPRRVRAPRRGGAAPRAAGAARAGRRDRLGLRARPRARRGARAARAVRDGQPPPPLLVPGARLRDLRPMGEGRHLRFSSARAGPARARSRSAAAGSWASRPASRSTRPSASSATSGTAPSSRGSCWATRGPAPRTRSRCSASRTTTWRRRSRCGTSTRCRRRPIAEARTVLDRRGQSPLAVLRDASRPAAGARRVRRRPAPAERLAARTGGFSLISYHALARDPRIGERFAQLVALDPPAARTARPAARRLRVYPLGVGRA